MPYFLSDKNLVQGSTVEIAGEEARHILLAHRAKKGEEIKLQGPDGKRHEAEIVEIGRNKLKLKIGQEITAPSEPKISITLFQSVVSEKALDFIFQKGTELGLSKIVLFNSTNTAAKLSQDKFQTKKDRWQKILIESAKQSERAKWLSLEFADNVNQVMEKIKSLDKVFLTDVSGQSVKELINRPPRLAPGETGESLIVNSLGLIVGPEGGLTPEEVSQFKSLPNLQAISLGPILLRAETAALAGLAVLQNSLV